MSKPETLEETFCRLCSEAIQELGLSQLPHGLTDREIALIRRVQEKMREERARVASE